VILDAVPRIEAMKQRKERLKMAKRLPGIVVSEELPLDKFDETGETFVKFRRPTRWEVEELSKVQADSELTWDLAEKGRLLERRLTTMANLQTEMVFLCLVDSNVLDEEGEPYFKPGKNCRTVKDRPSTKTRDNFNAVWGALDSEVAKEIIDKLLDFHPNFDWRERGERGED
jgi:hypothetical protein